MRWNHYIDLRVAVSNAVRATCKQCGAAIAKGTYRAEAIPVIGKKELLHLDCAAQRAPDHVKRKIKDKDPDWPADALEQVAKFLPEDATPAPRSYLRTPILDLSYGKPDIVKPCLFCGVDAPGEPGPGFGHVVRAFSADGERRFHPACVIQLAPGIARRVALEDSDRWPDEVKAFFNAALQKIAPTPRSPWRNTAGIPRMEPAPSGRAACRFCKEKIAKGELRLAREQLYGMRRSPAYFHVSCFCKSEDYHPKVLELVVLRLPEGVTREQVAELSAFLPPDPEEDDDVPPLAERLLVLFDAVPRTKKQVEEEPESKLKENVVEIPEGFFTS